MLSRGQYLLQIVVFPLFVKGIVSPVDDILDFGIAAVPLWTLAVATVYRNSKRAAVTIERFARKAPKERRNS
jgi:hypothetical protein